MATRVGSSTGRGLVLLSIIAGGAILGWLLAQGRAAPPRAAPPPAAPLVRVAPLQSGSHRVAVRTHGTVEPRTESDLVAEVSGRVVAVSPALAAGGFFEDGEVLVEIDRRDYANAAARARARVARAESELELAATELARQVALADRNITSDAALETARNAQRVARSVLVETRAELRQAERDVQRTRLTAPFAGRVRTKRVDVGQFVARGAPVARIYAVDFAEVRLPVRDADLAFLDIPLRYRGEPSPEPLADVVLSATFAGRLHTWPARIVRTEGEIDPASRMLHLVARVDEPYARRDERPPLAVGLFVDAEILGRTLDGVFAVPRSVVRPDGRIPVVGADSRVRLRPVDVVRERGEDAIVRATLEAGELLCLSPLEGAVDGMPVRTARVELEAAGADDPVRVAGAGP